ncbi:MAG: hypothetical protein AB7F59_04650 [Bdellovibrionales bacterium]
MKLALVLLLSSLGLFATAQAQNNSNVMAREILRKFSCSGRVNNIPVLVTIADVREPAMRSEITVSIRVQDEQEVFSGSSRKSDRDPQEDRDSTPRNQDDWQGFIAYYSANQERYVSLASVREQRNAVRRAYKIYISYDGSPNEMQYTGNIECVKAL